MNEDIFEGKWKQIRGRAREWWGRLSGNDLERVGGKADQLIGLLQQNYGDTREHSQEDFRRQVEEYRAMKDGSIRTA